MVRLCLLKMLKTLSSIAFRAILKQGYKGYVLPEGDFILAICC